MHDAILWLAITLAAGPGDARGLVAPTLVRLDFEDRTLTEIVAEVDRRGPNHVEVQADPRNLFPGVAGDPPKKEPRRFHLKEPESLPFWSAIDRIARLDGRSPVFLPGVPGRPARVTLVRSSGGRGFVSADRAFRVTLESLSFARQVRFTPDLFSHPAREEPGPPYPRDRETFAIAMILMAEPRLEIDRLAAVTLREAVDDRGRSLLLAPPSEPQPHGTSPSPGPQGGPVARLLLRLKYPDPPGETIRRLRGTVSVDVSETRPDGRDATVNVAFDFKDIPMP